MADVLKIEDLIKDFNSGATGEIVRTQTTYLDVVCSFPPESSLSQKYRIHYRGKREFSLDKGDFISLQLLDNHPLLLEYTEPFIAVQLISSVSDKQLFREELEYEINQVFGGWRSVEEYNFIPLDKFLEESYGILIEAPKSFAEAVMRAAERSGVKLTMLERHEPKGIFPRVLFLDERYIIADDFRVGRVE